MLEPLMELVIVRVWEIIIALIMVIVTIVLPAIFLTKFSTISFVIWMTTRVVVVAFIVALFDPFG